VHAAVDVAVVFLGVAFLFFVVDLPFWLTVVVSLIAGVVAAPFTRRAEERALARRPHPG
jgi:membrane protein implicated in regulation of membrane protease activity